MNNHPSITPENLISLVSVNLSSGIPFIVWSERGIGKLTLLTSVAESAGFHVIRLSSNIMDALDFGKCDADFQWKSSFVKDVEDARKDGKKVAILFDELSAATDAAYEAFSKGVLFKEVGAIKLEDGDIVFGSGLVDSNGNFVNKLIYPVINRVAHYHLGLPVAKVGSQIEV